MLLVVWIIPECVSKQLQTFLPYIQMSQVRALKHQIQSVGKYVKSSKNRHFWSLSIGQRFYHIVLDLSMVSCKSKLSINGKIFHQNGEAILKRTTYDHSFIIDGCIFNISQKDQSVQLRINNKLFSHMLTQQVCNATFQEHKISENSFELQNNTVESKKITLSLPGMGGMKKKKGPSVQTEKWGQFAGEMGGFPSFFGENSNKVESKPQFQAQITPQRVQTQPVVLRTPTADQFNTIQNLFKTINNCGQYIPKKAEQSTPVYQATQIPNLPQINLQQFNTMQNLFSTINIQSKAQPQKKEAEQTTTQLTQKDFSTMQNLFATLKAPVANSEVKVQVKSQLRVQKLPTKSELDFNTMQNLFNTIKPAKQQQIIPPSKQENHFANFGTISNPPKTVERKPSQDQFKTIQCVAQSKEQKLTPQTQNVDFSKININDFSTMQQLFATNSLTNSKQILNITDKANKVEENPQKKVQSAPNMMDFNTMQNMFATKKTQKNENAFWQF